MFRLYPTFVLFLKLIFSNALPIATQVVRPGNHVIVFVRDPKRNRTIRKEQRIVLRPEGDGRVASVKQLFTVDGVAKARLGGLRIRSSDDNY